MATPKTHSKCDYIAGGLTIASPYLFGFSHVPEARHIFAIAGITLILYSLLTDYTESGKKVLPFSFHRLADLIVAGMIMIAPSTFNYKDMIHSWQEGIHYILGLSIIAMVAFTRKKEAETSQTITPSPAPTNSAENIEAQKRQEDKRRYEENKKKIA